MKTFLILPISLLLSLTTNASLDYSINQSTISNEAVTYDGEVFQNTFMQVTKERVQLEDNSGITPIERDLKESSHKKSHYKNELQAFTADGCSSFPDGPFYNPTQWRHCCVAHDISYWAGGTYNERLNADKRLKQCVTNASNIVMGEMMYRGVRIGGSPDFRTTWRWGYGWKQLRGNRALTEEEKIEVSIASQDIPEDLSQIKIITPVKNYFKLRSETGNYCVDESVNYLRKKYGKAIRIDSIKFGSGSNRGFRRLSPNTLSKTYVKIESSICSGQFIFNFGKIRSNTCTKAVYDEQPPVRLRNVNRRGGCRDL